MEDPSHLVLSGVPSSKYEELVFNPATGLSIIHQPAHLESVSPIGLVVIV